MRQQSDLQRGRDGIGCVWHRVVFVLLRIGVRQAGRQRELASHEEEEEDNKGGEGRIAPLGRRLSQSSAAI